MNAIYGLLLVVFSSTAAQAGVQVKLDFFYDQEKEVQFETGGGNGNDDITTTEMNYRFGLGWTKDFGSGRFFLGAGIFNKSTEIEQSPHDGGASSTTEIKISAIGPIIGYEISGFDIDFMYYMDPTAELKSTGNPLVEYGEGSGFDISLGYLFDFGNFSIGPRLVIQKLSWDEVKSSGTTAPMTTSEEFDNKEFYLAFEYNFMK